MHYSPFIKRVLAFVIDLAIINLGAIMLGNVALGLTGNVIDPAQLEAVQAGAPADPAFVQTLWNAVLILSVVCVAIVVLVDVIAPASRWMASPGKKMLGMIITDEAGERIGFGKAIGRHAAKLVSCLSVVGMFMPLWTDKRQALHDRMAGTVVVREKGLAG